MVVYRAEVIGSLLRPSTLLDARRKWQTGELPDDAFKRIEDSAVDQAIAIQEAAGVDVVTDGELRRNTFIGPLTDTVEGLGPVPQVIGAQKLWQESDGANRPTPQQQTPFAVVGKLRRRRSLVAEEFVYLRARAKKPIKATLPSPLMLALLWSPIFSAGAYPDPFSLFADAAAILRDEIAELKALGCTYIQIDAPELATLVDPTTRAKAYAEQGVPPERLLGEGVDLLNAVADTPGVTFGLHLCRGNNAGKWMASGGYGFIARQVFRRAIRYSILALEYDDHRSGDFAPLAEVPPDKIIVLGLVSTKSDVVESRNQLIARIDEAARYVPRDHLALSTQCGFASVSAGNPIAWATQRAKLELVAEVAHQIWS
jgi:5-methyltetrahydropteroyltriglutamate--homocysteine methyltransferase